MKWSKRVSIGDRKETFRWWCVTSVAGIFAVGYNIYTVMNFVAYTREATASLMAWVFLGMMCLITCVWIYLWISATLDYLTARREDKIDGCYNDIHSLPVEEQDVTPCYTCKHKSICYGARDVTKR